MGLTRVEGSRQPQSKPTAKPPPPQQALSADASLTLQKSSTDTREQGIRSTRLIKAMKTSVDVGIQADAREIQLSTPKTRSATRKRSSKTGTASIRSVQRIQPLVVKRASGSIATATSTPLLKSRPNQVPLRISRPSTVFRIHHGPVAPSPKALRSSRQLVSETTNSRIADVCHYVKREEYVLSCSQVLSEINDTILHKISSKLEAVRDELKMAQRRMLVDTKEKLEQMHQVK